MSIEVKDKILYRDLSFRVNGVLFKVQNELGRFCREKQYGDLVEKYLAEAKIPFVREYPIVSKKIDNVRSNIVDFIVDGSILLDLKAKPIVTKEDYFQMQRYLQFSNLKLGIIANFRNRYLRPIRVINASR